MRYEIEHSRRSFWSYFSITNLLGAAFIGAVALFVGLMVKVLIQDPSAFSSTPSTPDRAYVAVSSMGMKDIVLGGAPLFACGKDDSLIMSHSFTATNIVGVKVAGNVCCGFFKGCTVRF